MEQGSSPTLRGRILLFLKGMAMGAADSVPGVSGGTIAFITNIYEELIYSIKSINLQAVKTLLGDGPAAAWRTVNGTFLLVLLAGILSSLMLLANTILFLLENYREALLAFFTGLILASCWYVASKVRRWDPLTGSLALIGATATIALSFVPESGAELSLPYLFFCGAVAICAMILPGISGAFILILLGAYERVLDALRNLEAVTVLVFAAGCACGLIAFSNFLSWLFRHHRERTLGFLLGILAGSLYSIWPWKRPSAFRVDSAGEQVPVLWENISPAEFAALNGEALGVGLALLLAAAGFLLVYGLEKVSGRN